MARISIFFNPIQSLLVLSKIIWIFLSQSLLNFLKKYFVLIAILSSIFYLPRQFEGSHQKVVKTVDEFFMFVCWWVGLGIASSVGLGTGLHTFMMYLGPYIVQVALIANQCNEIPEMLPSRYNFETFNACSTEPKGVTFFEIIWHVKLECFLWGFGTAIGELPPYFVSRAAALSYKKSEAQDEIQKIESSQEQNTLEEKVKHFIYKNLKKYAFVTIMVLASVPNPLFDFAGILCGHFLIPFHTFFTATVIGKAINKVSIQSVFVVFIFFGKNLDLILEWLQGKYPSLAQQIQEQLAKSKNALQNGLVKDEAKPLIMQLWDYIILAMILYFVYSILDQLINSYEEESQEEKKTWKDDNVFHPENQKLTKKNNRS